MRGKKTYIGLIAIFLVFFAFMFVIFGLPSIKKKKYSANIIVGEQTIWNYKDNKWTSIKANTSIQDLSWQEYNVFINNQKVGNYYLWHDDKWYAFDKNRKAIVLDGYLLAYQANFDLKVFSFSEEEIVDRTYVDYVLEQNNLDITSQFTISSKVSFDFDNDGVIEDFYLISNAFSYEVVPDNIFSLVFMVKNNTIYPIYTDVDANRGFNGCQPYLRSFLDVDNDNTSEFILSCSKYSIAGDVDMLYKFENDEFKIIISNQ